jgi:histidine transport system permease protein
MLYGYLPSLFDGAWVTLRVAVFSLLLALALGLAGASSRLSPHPCRLQPTRRSCAASRTW